MTLACLILMVLNGHLAADDQAKLVIDAVPRVPATLLKAASPNRCIRFVLSFLSLYSLSSLLLIKGFFSGNDSGFIR
jgi:hypothetical protein